MSSCILLVHRYSLWLLSVVVYHFQWRLLFPLVIPFLRVERSFVLWTFIHSLIVQHVEALEILLQGICGVPRERLRLHEICLKSGPSLGIHVFLYPNISYFAFSASDGTLIIFFLPLISLGCLMIQYLNLPPHISLSFLVKWWLNVVSEHVV